MGLPVASNGGPQRRLLPIAGTLDVIAHIKLTNNETWAQISSIVDEDSFTEPLLTREHIFNKV